MRLQFATALHLIRFVLELALGLALLNGGGFLVVQAVMVGRGGGVGGRDGGGDGVSEHGHELLVVELIELAGRAGGGAGGGAGVVGGRVLEEGNGVAGGSAVGAALGGGEIEEFIDPGGVVGVGGGGRWRGG